MTITTPREQVLAFSDPYYYTPAQIAASTASGITDPLTGLPARPICVGEATTYYDWMTGALDLGSYTPTTKPPEGSQATTPARTGCAPRRGRPAARTSKGGSARPRRSHRPSPTGSRSSRAGDPVYSEPLGVAFDKSGPRSRRTWSSGST